MEKRALKMFWHWINERERIRINREERGHNPPWTKDEILASYRFCNVRREDDRVTRWVKENIRDPYKYDPNLWFMLVMARNFNLPYTLDSIMQQDLWPKEETGYKPKRIAKLLNKQMENNAVFNAAYIINAANAEPDHTKVDHICLKVLSDLWKDRNKLRTPLRTSIEKATRTLMNYHGMGSFMSYQVVVDLSWCPGWLIEAQDLNSWAAIGPGSRRGISRLIGQPLRSNMSLDEGIEHMLKLYEMQPVFLKEELFHGNRIRLSDIQNCLCEFDKYARAKSGKGTPKRRVHYV